MAFYRCGGGNGGEDSKYIELYKIVNGLLVYENDTWYYRYTPGSPMRTFVYKIKRGKYTIIQGPTTSNVLKVAMSTTDIWETDLSTSFEKEVSNGEDYSSALITLGQYFYEALSDGLLIVQTTNVSNVTIRPYVVNGYLTGLDHDLEWDFTESLIADDGYTAFTLKNGLTRDSGGLHITGGSQHSTQAAYVNIPLCIPGVVYEISIGSLSPYNSNAQALVCSQSYQGVHYVSGRWVFKGNKTRTGNMSTEEHVSDTSEQPTDYSVFDNKKMIIKTSCLGDISIYSDDILVFHNRHIGNLYPSLSTSFSFGMPTYSNMSRTFYNATIKGLKIYNET